jgi:hypothetical protein
VRFFRLSKSSPLPLLDDPPHDLLRGQLWNAVQVARVQERVG